MVVAAVDEAGGQVLREADELPQLGGRHVVLMEALPPLLDEPRLGLAFDVCIRSQGVTVFEETADTRVLQNAANGRGPCLERSQRNRGRRGPARGEPGARDGESGPHEFGPVLVRVRGQRMTEVVPVFGVVGMRIETTQDRSAYGIGGQSEVVRGRDPGAADPPTVIAIDIPIGLPETGTRIGDLETRAAVGPRCHSVFLTPIRAAIEAPTNGKANARSRSLTGAGMTRQAYGLRTKILEVDAWLPTAQCTVHEVHPELSFATMAGHPLNTSKHTWSGVRLRTRLLEEAGIALSDLGAAGDRASVDDVLDAAAAAWSARRIAQGIAITIPTSPPLDSTGRALAIWA